MHKLLASTKASGFMLLQSMATLIDSVSSRSLGALLSALSCTRTTNVKQGSRCRQRCDEPPLRAALHNRQQRYHLSSSRQLTERCCPRLTVQHFNAHARTELVQHRRSENHLEMATNSARTAASESTHRTLPDPEPMSTNDSPGCGFRCMRSSEANTLGSASPYVLHTPLSSQAMT